MKDVHHIEQISQDCSLTEFVGTTVLDTIGLVIPGIDPSLLEKMNLKKPYKSHLKLILPNQLVRLNYQPQCYT